MADGYRFPQQGAGSYYFPQHTQVHHPRHQIIRNGTPPNNIRSVFNADTPSPSRSPEPHSPAHNLYGMFGHQQGQHGRANGGAGGRGMQMMYNFQQHQNPNQQHAQHHTNIQQDQSAHTTNGSVLGHHATYSSGVLSNSTPTFTSASLQNGHAGVTRGGQAQTINEHWALQLELHKDSENAHQRMADGAPNHFARVKAGENKGIAQAAPASESTENQEEGENNLGRMADNNPSKRQDWHNLDLSGQGLRVLTSPVFNYTFLKELYVASNKLTRLPPAISQLRYLTHLDASNNQLAELPPDLGMCVYLTQLLVFDNNITDLPTQIGSLFNLEMLGVEGNPLNHKTKQMIMNEGTKALITELRETAPIPEPPPPRAIISLQDSTQEPPPNQDKFKVFSYNILSAPACTTRLYGHSPTAALAWEHRRSTVLEDIRLQDADFVCLQEVDDHTFKEYFCVELAHNGYKGIFWARTRSRTMGFQESKNVDGCATFYKHKKYICLDKTLVDFANLAINRPDMSKQADIFNRVMPRDHIGVVTFFENIVTGSRLILANTHFFWDPAYSDVKLIQAAMLLGEISKLADKWVSHPAQKDKDKKRIVLADEENPSDLDTEVVSGPSKEYLSKTQIPLVICADQNSEIDSTVSELFSKGVVKPDIPEFKDRAYGNFTKDGIEHPFSLRSAYTNLDKTAEAVPYTNYTPGFKGVIDHIWYSVNALENVALLGKVDEDYMATVPGFPNYHFPSDHLSLMAEFAMKGTKAKKVITEPDFGSSSRNGDRRRN